MGTVACEQQNVSRLKPSTQVTQGYDQKTPEVQSQQVPGKATAELWS